MLGLFVCLANQKTTRMAFTNATISVGSGKQCHLSLQDGDVATDHCELRVVAGTSGVPARWYVNVAREPRDLRRLARGACHPQ